MDIYSLFVNIAQLEYGEIILKFDNSKNQIVFDTMNKVYEESIVKFEKNMVEISDLILQKEKEQKENLEDFQKKKEFFEKKKII